MIELEEMHSKELLVDVTYYYDGAEYEGNQKIWNASVELVDVQLFGNSVYELVDNYQLNVIEETILNLHQGE
jgi:hypothetical protein